MAAPIVYDGVAGEAGAGSLFNGQKFWIAQRVPTRLAWVEKVQANGGTVVPLENRADFLIADHARRDAPPGSYSWRLIDDAVKNGGMGNKEDYLIHRAVAASRPPGSSQPGKGTRTPFTAADDELLWRWTLLNERQGNSLKGNMIWPTLANMYPHHTWQSWRDRWMKKLSLMERPQHLPSAGDDLPSLAPPENTVPMPSTPQRAVASQPVPVPRSGGSGQRLKFTEEDDRILLAYVRDAQENGRPLRGNVIYKEIEDLHPHHTYQSWRDRYVRHLSSRPVRNMREDRPNDSTPGLSHPARHKSRLAESVQGSPQQQNTASHSDVARLEPKVTETKSPVKNTNLRNDDPAAATVQRGNSERRQGSNLMNKKSSPEPSIQEPSPPEVHPAEPAGRGTGHESDDLVEYRPISVMSATQFYRDIQEYMRAADVLLNLWPQIGGLKFSLYKLFEAALKQEREPRSRDWEQIAEDLNIDWIEHPDAPAALEKCFEENLGDFERLLMQFEDEDDEEDDEDDMQTSRSREPSEVELPSFPHRVAGQKRSAPSSLMTSDPAYPSETSRKRRRVDPGSEIPSTPDDKNGPAGGKASLLKGKGKAIDSPSSQHLSSLPDRRRKRFFEPETQDFGYDPETQAYPTIEDEAEAEPDITPSQQLAIESPCMAPIPLSLPKPQPASFRRAAHRQQVADSPTDPEIKEEAGNSPAPESVATKPSPSALRATRRSLPNTFKPATEPASRRQTGSAPSEPPSNGTSARQTLNNHGSAQPAAGAAAAEPGSVQEVIEHFMSLGYPQKLVVTALKSTTMKPGYPTTVVLERLEKGEGIPGYYEGVWTAKDDEGLRFVVGYERATEEGGGDERKMRKKAENEAKRLAKKHGEEGVEERRKFLAMMAGE